MQKAPMQLFAELEYEISTYHVAPPKPWPWAINSDGTTDMALRSLQLLEFVEKLRKIGEGSGGSELERAVDRETKIKKLALEF